jgi:hypothetical protein
LALDFYFNLGNDLRPKLGTPDFFASRYDAAFSELPPHFEFRVGKGRGALVESWVPVRVSIWNVFDRGCGDMVEILSWKTHPNDDFLDA